jgi:hypothetical protein
MAAENFLDQDKNQIQEMFLVQNRVQNSELAVRKSHHRQK